MLNAHETTAVGDGDGTGVESGADDATDGLRRMLDALRGHRDVQGTRNSTDTTADMMETIRACQDTAKLPNSPVEPGKWRTNSRVEFRSCTGTPNMHRVTGDTQETTISIRQQSQNYQTHSLGGQRGTQMTQTGLRATEVRRRHAYMCKTLPMAWE